MSEIQKHVNKFAMILQKKKHMFCISCPYQNIFFIFSFFAKGTQTNCHVAIDIYSKARIALVRRIEEW